MVEDPFRGRPTEGLSAPVTTETVVFTPAQTAKIQADALSDSAHRWADRERQRVGLGRL